MRQQKLLRFCTPDIPGLAPAHAHRDLQRQGDVRNAFLEPMRETTSSCGLSVIPKRFKYHAATGLAKRKHAFIARIAVVLSICSRLLQALYDVRRRWPVGIADARSMMFNALCLYFLLHPVNLGEQIRGKLFNRCA